MRNVYETVMKGLRKGLVYGAVVAGSVVPSCIEVNFPIYVGGDHREGIIVDLNFGTQEESLISHEPEIDIEVGPLLEQIVSQ